MKIGFNFEGEYICKKIFNEVDRKNIAIELISKGALFSEGRDWSPAKLIALYSEQGIVTTSYQVIEWKAPENYMITTYNSGNSEIGISG